MIEADQEGQKKIYVLVENIGCDVFNEWEKKFIRELRNKKYSRLSNTEKAFVNRLYGWWLGR